MSDSTLDKLNAATVKMTSSYLADFFKPGPFDAFLLHRSFIGRLKMDWERQAATRMLGMGVSRNRVVEVLKEMNSTGKYLLSTTPYDYLCVVDGFEAGNGMQETLNDGGTSWDGNIYATYGTIKRK